MARPFIFTGIFARRIDLDSSTREVFMAQIVLAFGISHGPTIQSEPEKWRLLGKRDVHDPRMDYQALLKKARADLNVEISPATHAIRYAAIRRALDEMRRLISEARLDIMVVVSNMHRVGKSDPHPVFGLLRAESFAVTPLTQELFKTDTKFLAESSSSRQPDPALDVKPGHPGLANHLIDGLIQCENFDVACTDQLPVGHALDDAYSFIYEELVDHDIPMVPVMLSRNLPNQANAARCYDFGLALRRQIESWPEPSRIGLIASGGLSHQIVDEELDRRVIKAMVEGDANSLRNLSREKLNSAPGTPEILNWVVVSAAMSPSPMQLIDYVPCYRSLAGTGHGVGFGCWR